MHRFLEQGFSILYIIRIMYIDTRQLQGIRIGSYIEIMFSVL